MLNPVAVTPPENVKLAGVTEESAIGSLKVSRTASMNPSSLRSAVSRDVITGNAKSAEAWFTTAGLPFPARSWIPPAAMLRAGTASVRSTPSTRFTQISASLAPRCPPPR